MDRSFGEISSRRSSTSFEISSSMAAMFAFDQSVHKKEREREREREREEKGEKNPRDRRERKRFEGLKESVDGGRGRNVLIRWRLLLFTFEF